MKYALTFPSVPQGKIHEMEMKLQEEEHQIKLVQEKAKLVQTYSIICQFHSCTYFMQLIVTNAVKVTPINEAIAYPSNLSHCRGLGKCTCKVSPIYVQEGCMVYYYLHVPCTVADWFGGQSDSSSVSFSPATQEAVQREESHF